MMKRSINIILILSLLVVTFCPITHVNAAANTLREYKNELAKVKSQKEENNRLTSESIAEIDQKRNAIVNANNTITSNENKVEQAKVKIAESQEQIKVKNEELKDVINVLHYSQINSDEIYMDYLFDSSSISELMERQAIVGQIVGYTQQQLDDLDALIKENEKLQVKLADDNVNLTNSISEYEKKVEELEAFIEKRATIGMGYDDKIKEMEGWVKEYEKAGCKDSDSLNTCYYDKLSSGQIQSGFFSRPLNYGKITQAWGNNGHKGMDIGGNAKGTPIYAPANGTVASVVYKSSCGGNIIYMHFTVNGKAYTGEFAHLTSINVKKGQYVTKGSVIGTIGGDSSTWYYDKCTTGLHLHYAIAYGYYLGGGSNGYTSWSTFTSNTKATSVQAITGIKNQRGWTWRGR